MSILPLYAALLAVLFILLSVRTIRMRRTLQIGIGDRGDERMLRAMRVHSNFAEYVPLTLLLIYLVEAQQAPVVLVHALGICLLVGRLSHAYGVSQAKENFRFRIFGMVMTFTTIGVAAAFLLYSFVWHHLG